MLRHLNGKDPLIFPRETIIGSLCNYITTANSHTFQPMKANFGILPPISQRLKSKKDRNLLLSNRAIESIITFASKNEIM